MFTFQAPARLTGMRVVILGGGPAGLTAARPRQNQMITAGGPAPLLRELDIEATVARDGTATP